MCSCCSLPIVVVALHCFIKSVFVLWQCAFDGHRLFVWMFLSRQHPWGGFVLLRSADWAEAGGQVVVRTGAWEQSMAKVGGVGAVRSR